MGRKTVEEHGHALDKVFIFWQNLANTYLPKIGFDTKKSNEIIL